MNDTVNRIETFEAFPKNVIEQANAASRIRTASQLSRRLDLRSKTIFTFGEKPDSPSSCAFSVYPNGIGWQLGIHVADVSEYVPEGSPIDVEARRRLAAVSNGFVKTEMLFPSVKTDSRCPFYWTSQVMASLKIYLVKKALFVLHKIVYMPRSTNTV